MVKYYKTITQKEWNETPKDYKTIKNGIHYKLYLTNKGTTRCPVRVVKSYGMVRI